MEEPETIVIGAGAAGLIAAERSASIGRRTLLLEKAPKAGVKILMSGGTRCNVTHATDAAGIVAAYGPAGRFLHSPLSYLGPDDVVALFAAEGVPTKIESTGKVFPRSDRAIDVRDALVERLHRSGASLKLKTAVRSLVRDGDRFEVQADVGRWTAPQVIVTVGGRSYPGCGTTGDGYPWLAELGHEIVPPVPSLVPLTLDAPWLRELQGLTFDPVEVAVWDVDDPAARRPKRPLARCRSSLLITHVGLSGPAAMNVSREVARRASHRTLLTCDWFPDRTVDNLLAELLERRADEPRKSLAAALARIVFARFAEALVRHLGCDPERRLAEVPMEWFRRIAAGLKGLPLVVTGTLGFAKAEVTAGGVRLSEVDSRTMASRKVPGLYLAGEVLDLDGPIGGFNFQAAFATGWLAGYQGTPPETWREANAARARR
ncbi:MAG TPA: aminoacetone oxidase family FAD-binding enzyme [Planctomycetaceae bacterium]|nr:aminoacetone oxidase family FAD-binding enzyme [Planctomycetaceae bacterium]HRE99388.1 NAD(P)/FAD-dependent oxidoreductase [Pirellulaceae bacterium]